MWSGGRAKVWSTHSTPRVAMVYASEFGATKEGTNERRDNSNCTSRWVECAAEAEASGTTRVQCERRERRLEAISTRPGHGARQGR